MNLSLGSSPPFAEMRQNKIRELLEYLYPTQHYNVVRNDERECLKRCVVRQSAAKRRIGEGSEAIP